MIKFANKQALQTAYARATGEQDTLTARGRTKYVPHLYRGGFVIPGFGYSIERIGVYVTQTNAGDPFFVE